MFFDSGDFADRPTWPCSTRHTYDTYDTRGRIFAVNSLNHIYTTRARAGIFIFLVTFSPVFEYQIYCRRRYGQFIKMQWHTTRTDNQKARTE